MVTAARVPSLQNDDFSLIETERLMKAIDGVAFIEDGKTKA